MRFLAILLLATFGLHSCARADTPWNTITFSWSPATVDLQGGPITPFYYNVWLSTKLDGSAIAYKTQVAANVTSFTLTGLAAGTYCFQVLVGAGYAESGLSTPPACKTISAPVVVRPNPAPPTNTKVT